MQILRQVLSGPSEMKTKPLKPTFNTGLSQVNVIFQFLVVQLEHDKDPVLIDEFHNKCSIFGSQC